jgi:hypothetical protein
MEQFKRHRDPALSASSGQAPAKHARIVHLRGNGGGERHIKGGPSTRPRLGGNQLRNPGFVGRAHVGEF